MARILAKRKILTAISGGVTYVARGSIASSLLQMGYPIVRIENVTA
jgi:hypothetical protein